LINGFTPALGDTFQLFDGPATGNFAGVNFAPPGPGMTWDVSNLASGGSIVAVVPEPSFLILPALAVGSMRRRRWNNGPATR
jgi:hypothetical protein